MLVEEEPKDGQMSGEFASAIACREHLGANRVPDSAASASRLP